MIQNRKNKIYKIQNTLFQKSPGLYIFAAEKLFDLEHRIKCQFYIKKEIVFKRNIVCFCHWQIVNLTDLGKNFKLKDMIRSKYFLSLIENVFST